MKRHSLLVPSVCTMALPFTLGGCDQTPPTPQASTTTPRSIASDSTPVPPPPHEPTKFRATIEELVITNRFGEAIAYLEAADPKKQAAHDGTGYLAVGGFTIRLPGVEDDVDLYDPRRDWLIPGTSEVIDRPDWHHAAEQFATEYNKARQGDDDAH